MHLIDRIKIFTILPLLFVAHLASAQWEEGQINVLFSLPEIALVDIEPSFNNSIHFTIVPSAESGGSPVVKESAEQQLWINYSSALSGDGNSRKIVAEISNGQLPKGVELLLEASGYSGNGDGNLGQPSGEVSLGTQPRPVITSIGNCYTGDGINNGHSLSFSLNIVSYSEIQANQASEFTILYTITDN